MMNFLVLLLIVFIALGTLFFMIGYGALFLGAFSHSGKIAVILLIILGFSSVGFVYFGRPWYYALPFWLLPAAYAHFVLPPTRQKKRALLAFWLGVVFFVGSTGFLFYTATQNADIKATIEQLKNNKKQDNLPKLVP